MKKRSIITELEKIEQKSKEAKAKKIIELTEEFAKNPLEFMGIDADTKQEITMEILARKITPKFDQEPRIDRFETKYLEWNWLQEDPQLKDQVVWGLNLKSKPFIGESHDTFSVVEPHDTDTIKLIFDTNHPCIALKNSINNKNVDYLDTELDSCKKTLQTEFETFETFIEKVKKKEDYFDLMAKQQL